MKYIKTFENLSKGKSALLYAKLHGPWTSSLDCFNHNEKLLEDFKNLVINIFRKDFMYSVMLINMV